MPKRDSHASSPRRTSSSSHRSKRRDQQDDGAGNGSRTGDGGGDASAAVQPDFASSDPYAILGVSRDATPKQIKLSYRKLALKHHPDRQNSDSDKKVAHEHFAAIGHAYEILGDEGRRREFDEGLLQRQQQQQQHQPRHQRREHHGSSRDFDNDPFSPYSDPFFSFGFGGRGSSRSGFHFTDPFELFEQFFAEEMRHHRQFFEEDSGHGDHSSRHHSSRHSRHCDSSSRSSRGMDPFASDPFFSSDPFASDPFFSGGMMGGGSLFGHMSGHFDRMNTMMSQMHQMHSNSMLGGFGDQEHQMIGNGGNGGGSSYNFASSTRSSSNRGGQTVSTSTKTTIINGKRKTVRERTVVNPDGTVDRHVETVEGDDSNDTGRLPSASRPALDYDHGNGRRSGRRFFNI